MQKWANVYSFFVQLGPRLALIKPFVSMRNIRFQRNILSAIIAGIAIGSAISPIAGYDWYIFYHKFAFDPFLDASPMWIYMVITPIAMLPHSFSIFTILNGLLLIASLYLIDHPHFLLVLTLPVSWILFYGQIDGWMVFASVLGLWSIKNKKAVWLGVAIIILCSKPHIGFPLALYFLFVSRSVKALIVPTLVFLISLAVYGFWPIAFVQNYLDLNTSIFIDQQINSSFWPWSLLCLPLMAFFWRSMDVKQRAVAILATTCLIVPYSPTYSLAPLLFMTAASPALALLLVPAWFGAEITAVSGTLFSLGCLLHSLFCRTPVEVFQKAELDRP